METGYTPKKYRIEYNTNKSLQLLKAVKYETISIFSLTENV